MIYVSWTAGSINSQHNQCAGSPDMRVYSYAEIAISSLAHAHSILMAIVQVNLGYYPGKPGLAGCPIDSQSPLS